MLNSGLEGFLKESTAGQKGNILIHTKLIVVDFTADAPTVISGSHNLSASASNGNDENYLILRGATDVADCYGVELMRLYDHYRFRFSRSARTRKAGARAGDRRQLDEPVLRARQPACGRPSAIRRQRGVNGRAAVPVGVVGRHGHVVDAVSERDRELVRAAHRCHVDGVAVGRQLVVG